MKKQFYIGGIIALISILSFATINNYDGMTLINAQQTIDSDNNTNIIKLENIPTKQVRVEDIVISTSNYSFLGKK